MLDDVRFDAHNSWHIVPWTNNSLLQASRFGHREDFLMEKSKHLFCLDQLDIRCPFPPPTPTSPINNSLFFGQMDQNVLRMKASRLSIYAALVSNSLDTWCVWLCFTVWSRAFGTHPQAHLQECLHPCVCFHLHQQTPLGQQTQAHSHLPQQTSVQANRHPQQLEHLQRITLVGPKSLCRKLNLDAIIIQTNFLPSGWSNKWVRKNGKNKQAWSVSNIWKRARSVDTRLAQRCTYPLQLHPSARYTVYVTVPRWIHTCHQNKPFVMCDDWRRW